MKALPSGIVVVCLSLLTVVGCGKEEGRETVVADNLPVAPAASRVPPPTSTVAVSAPREYTSDLPAIVSDDSEEENEPTVRGLDGETKECEVYSFKSAGTYTLDVEFEGEQAKINFPNGGFKYVDIDDPDGTDFSTVAATDSDGESWEINVTDPPLSVTSDDEAPETPDDDPF